LCLPRDVAVCKCERDQAPSVVCHCADECVPKPSEIVLPACQTVVAAA
jgi:hypothetical protein